MRKAFIAVIAAAALFAVGAFAASFALDAEDVSSGSDGVACFTTASPLVTVNWTVADPATAAADYQITAATLTYPDTGCAGEPLKLAIRNGNAVLTTCTGTVGASPQTIALSGCSPSGALNVGAVTSTALLIGDTPVATP